MIGTTDAEHHWTVKDPGDSLCVSSSQSVPRSTFLLMVNPLHVPAQPSCHAFPETVPALRNASAILVYY